MRKILFAVLAVFGLGGGLAGGQLLRPAEPEHGEEMAEGHTAPPAEADGHAPEAEHAAPQELTAASSHDAPDPEHLPEYVKLSNQFVVPIIDHGQIASLIILSLSLEVAPGKTETVYAVEPKLRDMILQLLFDHSNTGGFAGSFTNAENLIGLRKNLLEVVQHSLGSIVTDVLITDIVRQDA